MTLVALASAARLSLIRTESLEQNFPEQRLAAGEIRFGIDVPERWWHARQVEHGDSCAMAEIDL